MTYVMSDIHGHYDKFLQMLEVINFTDDDTMIILGDVIDRGPNGITMLKDIMNRKNVCMTMGNHELMMLESLLGNGDDYQEACVANWIQNNGGHATMLELDTMSDEEVLKVLLFVAELPTAVDLEIGEKKFHLVHAWPCEDCYDALWTRPELDTPSPLQKDIQLIIGHTPVMFLHAKEDQNELMDYITEIARKGEYLKIEHTAGYIDIDCGAGQDLPISRVACLRLDDMKEFYV